MSSNRKGEQYITRRKVPLSEYSGNALIADDHIQRHPDGFSFERVGQKYKNMLRMKDAEESFAKKNPKTVDKINKRPRRSQRLSGRMRHMSGLLTVD